MPSQSTTRKAKEDLRKGKKPTTAAGEFVHEEIEHVRSGKHGARSTKQAIAIGLSKARRAGVPLKPPAKGKASEQTRRSAERAYAAGQHKGKTRSPSKRRSAATSRALRREPQGTVSHAALAQHARNTAPTHRKRGGTATAGP